MKTLSCSQAKTALRFVLSEFVLSEQISELCEDHFRAKFGDFLAAVSSSEETAAREEQKELERTLSRRYEP